MKDEQRNMLIFAVLAALILFAWNPVMRWAGFAPPPPRESSVVKEGRIESAPAANIDPAADGPVARRDRAIVLSESPRVQIESSQLKGSIALKGARIDDLVLKQYAETIAKGSDPIRLLSPSGAASAFFAGFGWSGTGITPPDANTVWTASAPTLSPGRPVTLTADSGGQRYQLAISVDNEYMFTVRQTIANLSDATVEANPYSYLSRAEKSADHDQWTSHVGPIVVANGTANYIDYSTVAQGAQQFSSLGGWAGFTDHYWLTALVPDQTLLTSMRVHSRGDRAFQADVTGQQSVRVPAGQRFSRTSRLFAGAKEVNVLNHYQDKEGVSRLDRAIDWGWFEIVENPIFHYLHWLYQITGNFGISIILLTLTIRLLMFPVAQRQFASMAKLRLIQPKMKALQEQHKEDKPRLQQETMKLYKDMGVNPIAGCLPTLLQIPVFYALYKVLMLSIEMRHKPFFLWIKDLSAPDPLTPVNLFGLLDFAPPSFLAIGVVPILLGVSMYYQFKLNPAPMDDMQKQVFAIMPWMLMFIMSSYAVGLQIYWITSNLVTIAQQRYLYRKHGATDDITPPGKASST